LGIAATPANAEIASEIPTSGRNPPVRRRPLLLVVLAAMLVVPAAQAGPGLLVGVNDDSPKWKDDPALTAAAADLGIASYRITLGWDGTQRALTGPDKVLIEKALANVRGKHVLLSVFGRPDSAPRTDEARSAYCAYVGDVLGAYPAIRTIGIWNEVNKASFWRPQFDGSTSVAPAEYVKLLAACATLRTAFPDVVLVSSLSPRGNDKANARSNVSHSPITFIAGMGAAVRGMALQSRIFDHFGQNVYGAASGERPFRSHPKNTDIAQGDYGKLMAALSKAFAGTAQPVPGTDGVTVWYLETGFQTTVPAEKQGLYSGVENDPSPLAPIQEGTDPGRSDAGSRGWDQASQLADAIRLASCQPAVGAFYNFHLADETDLAAWQSGVLWADGSPKPSFAAVKAAIDEVAAGSVDCSLLNVGVGKTDTAKKAQKRKAQKKKRR
jgi:hypothetical protein